MSSWKNAHKSYQKPHRERHQPDSRRHLGILEKKKDYKKRADDYNAKKSELKYLHKRALDKNPDEFYYHMINSQLDEGEHKDKAKDVEFTPDQLQLMQTQDYKYIATRRTMEAKKVEKLQSSLHLLSANEPTNKHTFFVDNEKEKRKFKLVDRLGTTKELLPRKYNRMRVEDLSKAQILSKGNPAEVLHEVIKEKGRSYKLLEKREERAQRLLRLQRKMEIKRTLQDKSRSVKKRIDPVDREAAPVYEFKQIRKR